MPVAVRSRPVRNGEPGSDPEPARAPPRVIGLRPEPRELPGLRGALQDLLAGDAVAQDLAGRGRVAGVVDVAPPDLERGDAQLLGDPVEVGLGRELGLRRPEAAERAVGRGVRPRRPGPDADVRAAVRAAGVERATRQHDRRQRAVRAAVHDDLDVLGHQPPVASDPGPVPDDGRVALRRRRDVLVAVVDHADRLLGLAREEGGMQADDRRELLLATEPAAGLGLDHACRPVVQTQAPLQGGVEVVRALQRARDRDAATIRRDGDHRVVLDVELLLVADAVLALEHDIRAGQGRLHVRAGLDRVLGEGVLGLERVEHAGQLRRPRRRPVAGLAQGRLVGRGDERQRLRVVLDLAADGHEDRLVGLDRADDVLARDVGGGHDDDLRPVEGGIELEGVEGGVRVGRADRGAVPRPGDDDVVGVQGRAGQLGRSFAAQRRGRPRATGHDGSGLDDDRGLRLGARRDAADRGSLHGARRYHRATLAHRTAPLPSEPPATPPARCRFAPSSWPRGAIRWSHSGIGRL